MGVDCRLQRESPAGCHQSRPGRPDAGRRRVVHTGPVTPAGGSITEPVVLVRPWRLRRWCIGVSIVFLAGFTASAVLLRRISDGQSFRVSDQAAVFAIGVCIAAGIMVFARPQVRADTRGVWVRNIFGSHDLPWEVVDAVVFPAKSAWAALELVDGDLLSMMALQLTDGDRAVAAMRGLRDLHERAVVDG